VESWLTHARVHVADVKAMLGLQMVTMTMDTTPLGRIGNIEAVDLFNQPNQQLLWALDFKASSHHETSR
jgi:hypothetical protein